MKAKGRKINVAARKQTLSGGGSMLCLSDIMTRDVVTVAPELSVRDAMALFATRHITGAPVVSRGRVVGVVSLTDLAEFASSAPGTPTERPEQAEWGEWDREDELPEDTEPPSAFFSDLWDDAGVEVSQRIRSTEGPEWSALDEHTVSEVMSRRISALPATTAVDRAADFMRSAGIHRVLVMDGERLLGLVSTSDIAAAVADHRLARRVYVFGPAKSPPER